MATVSATLLAASTAGVVARVTLALAIAMVTTSGALRLLRVRRGWGTALLASAIGWGLGFGLALGLAHWHWDGQGLAVHALAIAIPTTMAAAVSIDLLARPGSLAIGELAGLVVTPRPVRAVRGRIAVFRRYQELVRLLRRSGFGPFMSHTRRAQRSIDAPGVRMRRVLEEAGGVYIKLGQIAATCVDLLPKDVCDELSKLQNRVEPEPFDHVMAVVHEELGQEVRSGVILDQIAQGLRAELDFRQEARAMEEMAELLRGVSGVRVPYVHQAPCTRRLLVQEQFHGATVADAVELDGRHADRAALADQLMRATLHQVLRAGFFHADPHPGNIFVLSDGTLGLIDFGAVGRLDSIQKAAVIDMLVAVTKRDASLLREGIERVADGLDTTSPEQLERVLARLVADHVRPTGTVDPTILQDLVVALARFHVALPRDLVMLARTLVTLEGTLRLLAPEMSFVHAAMTTMQSKEAVVVDQRAMIGDELLAVLPHLRHLPERVDRILTLTGRGELRVRTVLDEDARRVVRTLANRALLAVVGATFLVASAMLIVATDPGPRVGETVGLFDVFGFGGLLLGTVLLLRVVATVARDGTT